MEIKQLEYFLAVCERGSFNKAADCLYTTQPNVSKVINNLEQELGRELFKRTYKGIELTPYGKTICQYAEVVLKHVQLMQDIALPAKARKLSVATYRSDIISKIFVDFYNEFNGEIFIEHYQGSVEEITDNVKKGICEIGIVYVAQNQRKIFNHILYHKNLQFKVLSNNSICVYFGPKHKFYEKTSVDFDELADLQFIYGVKDSFALEHHMEKINIGFKGLELLNNAVYTNSDDTIINLLLNTDLCRLGINATEKKYERYNIRAVPINDSDNVLTLGYVYTENQELSPYAKWFIEKFKQTV
ncbi:LysR family transcriptional regulator [Megamonas hypermegale]|uniref:LysR family transcriptional regulator n=1 Tax=Megamonas hypermegale TaxID=158847 RepID=A0A921HQY5_9FIRM|nr:LysR family transcriptional regulator [Megamonas hypermegale]MDM8143378.1 LysR family transcriptional regulator [Megamonas hypermegale]HJF85436.1 LysR family transcriptional regulator [Megamonas hypermegale]